MCKTLKRNVIVDNVIMSVTINVPYSFKKCATSGQYTLEESAVELVNVNCSELTIQLLSSIGTIHKNVLGECYFWQDFPSLFVLTLKLSKYILIK